VSSGRSLALASSIWPYRSEFEFPKFICIMKKRRSVSSHGPHKRLVADEFNRDKMALASTTSPLEARRESADAVLAMNLLVARTVMGITQQQLAEISGISRATIAQIETGNSDPRLSTIVELGRAVGLPAIFLLIGLPEIQTLDEVARRSDAGQPAIAPQDVARMRRHVATGMLKDRVRAAIAGAKAVESNGAGDLSRVVAAIFSTFLPGVGTQIGALIGEVLAESIPRIEPSGKPETTGRGKG